VRLELPEIKHLMNAACQFAVLRAVLPGEAVIVAMVLVDVPYLLFCRPLARLARRKGIAL
jgi:hypothetical protein